jgi:hypothetical protein
MGEKIWRKSLLRHYSLENLFCEDKASSRHEKKKMFLFIESDVDFSDVFFLSKFIGEMKKFRQIFPEEKSSSFRNLLDNQVEAS